MAQGSCKLQRRKECVLIRGQIVGDSETQLERCENICGTVLFQFHFLCADTPSIKHRVYNAEEPNTTRPFPSIRRERFTWERKSRALQAIWVGPGSAATIIHGHVVPARCRRTTLIARRLLKCWRSVCEEHPRWQSTNTIFVPGNHFPRFKAEPLSARYLARLQRDCLDATIAANDSGRAECRRRILSREVPIS